MWNAITWVTGGFTLIAFVSAVLAYTRLRIIRRDEVALGKAVASDIPAVLDRIAGRFHVDTASLTREQKHGLVIAQLRHQQDKFRLLLRYGLIALLLLVGLTAFTVWISTSKIDDPNAVPSAQKANGTAIAEIKLSPRTFNMVATLEAETTAHLSDGGRAELFIQVNGKECARQIVYKNWSAGPIFNIVTACTVPILANTEYTFHAEQKNEIADAHKTLLTVAFQR